MVTKSNNEIHSLFGVPFLYMEPSSELPPDLIKALRKGWGPLKSRPLVSSMATGFAKLDEDT